MDDHPVDQAAGQPAWTPLAELSAQTGRTVEALRKAVKRPGWDLPKRRRNDGSWEVLVGPADVRRLARGQADVGDAGQDVRGTRPMAGRGVGQGDGQQDVPDVALDIQIARLEERLAAAVEARRQVEELKEAFRQRVEELRADLERERRAREDAERRRAEDDRRLDEVLRQIGELREERRQRRPWPGLRVWWRRLIEGEERAP